MEGGKEESINSVHFLKTDPKARYQGYSFYFREGFRWSAINGTRSTNDLKFCYKGKTVNDVQGMSLCCATNYITSRYITAICNADFISRYTEAFINSTVIFQINDCRQIPIIMPHKSDLDVFTSIFEEAKQIVIGDNSHIKLEEIKSRLDEAVIKLYNL